MNFEIWPDGAGVVVTSVSGLLFAGLPVPEPLPLPQPMTKNAAATTDASIQIPRSMTGLPWV